jgi:hypothetical protein
MVVVVALLLGAGCTWNRSDVVAAPSAEVTSCGDTPTDAPGAGTGFTAASATVRLRNPTKTALRAHVLVDFGELGLGDANEVRVEGDSEVDVEVAPPVVPRIGGFDCELKEATFSQP